MSRAGWLPSVLVLGLLPLASLRAASQDAPPTRPGHAPSLAPTETFVGTVVETVDETGDAEAAPAPGTDLRDALAHVVIERNVVASQRDSLLQQRWLIIAYAAATSLLALWFLYVGLRRSSATGREPVMIAPTVATVRQHGRRGTNATITIRNGSTQQPEVIDRVSTRRLFRRPASEATTKVMAAPVRPASDPTKVPAKAPAPSPLAPLPASILKPAAIAALTPATRRATTTVAAKRPQTEPHEYPPTDVPPKPAPPRIGSESSILLAPQVTDALPDEPETTQMRIAKRQGRVLSRLGLSLLEVMISLAVLATVMASVSGGIFALSTAQRAAQENAAITGMMQMWSERLMGADWEWLGRDQLDDPLRGAWSWQRPEIEGTPATGDHPPLQEKAAKNIHDATVQLLADAPSGVTDLRCYLEYYHPIAMELCFMPDADTDVRALWNDVRPMYRLPPPIDLRQHLDAVVIRLSATWTSQAGGQRRRDLVFARTR